MDLDDVLTTWRAQDAAPLYRLDRDRLTAAVRRDAAALRRTVRWDHGVFYAFNALFVVAAALLAARLADDADRLAAAAVATVAGTAAGTLWWGHRRQAAREERFGDALRDEVARHLSIVDYRLSGAGHRAAALLTAAPITLAGCVIYGLIARLNHTPFGWHDVAIGLVIVGGSAWSAIDASRRIDAELRPRRDRLAELLAHLDAVEGD